ncbi:MAG TPA: glycosyltransferase [Xanthomonadales bacterium]|nr:glycosyltransferase [Xanthomonadales bacterium]
MSPQDFFELAVHSFHTAESASEKHSRVYGIAGLRIRVCFAGSDLIRPLTRALDHLRLSDVENGGAATADLTVLAWASESPGEMPPSPGAGSWNMGPNGSIRSLSDKRFKAAWMFAANGMEMLDQQSSRGLYWVRDATDLPYWEAGAPMRFLLDAWFASRGLLLVHAAGVGDERGAILLAGPGGAGKSTTALSSLQSKLNYLSDDYLLLDPQGWSAYSIYNSGKVGRESLRRLDFLENTITNSGRLEEEKALLFVHEAFPHKLLKGPLPVRAIACPVVGGGGAGCQPLTAAAALRALAPSTVFQSSRPSAQALGALARLVRERPCFKLHLTQDPSRAAEELGALLPGEGSSTRLLVSVVIPVYNPGPYLRDALASVLSQDAVRHENALEVIIIDDGSEEDFSAAIEEFSLSLDIRLQRQARQGPSAARNRGISMARGELVAFLDADDLWPAGSLAARTTALEQAAGADMVHGQLRNLIELEDDEGPAMFFGPPRLSFNVGSMLFRRRIFDRTGLLDEQLRFSEDVDFLVRMAETGIKRHLIETVCLYYRRHGGSLTGPIKASERGREHLKCWARILKHSLDRRRA